MLPLVTTHTREKTARELDDRGPDSCMLETLHELRDTNPEVLDMAEKCAASFGSRTKDIFLELLIFYRLLLAEYKAMDPRLRLLASFPRVSRQTRDRLLEQIDSTGEHAFTSKAIEDLEKSNPELLLMAHNSATRCGEYLPMMQGFALIYRALSEQAAADALQMSLH